MKTVGRALRRFSVWALRGLAKLGTALVIVACLLNWAVVGGLALAEAVFGITARTVATGSMAPTYNIGDVVWYLPSSGEHGKDLQVGRALAIAPNGDLSAIYTHRVVSVEEDGTATLAGDAFVANGIVDVYHPTQTDVEGIAFTVTKNDTAKWVISTFGDGEFSTLLTSLGLGVFALWLIVNFGLNRRDEGVDDHFADRFHEVELALMERGFISNPNAPASAADDDALDVFEPVSEADERT